MTTEWQLFEITQRGRNFPVSGNGVERGTAVWARYSRKLGDFIIYYCLGQPPAEGIGGHHPQCRCLHSLALIPTAVLGVTQRSASG